MPAIDHTPEDTDYVKLYLILPLILTAFERDKRIAEATFKTPRPYIELINEAIKRVETDIKEIRRMMRTLGIKVYEEQLTAKGIEAKYLCRGYQHNFSMLTNFLAAESSVLMEKYLGIDVVMKYINRYDPRPDKHGERMQPGHLKI
ncbi:hypothetical protein [Paenibacillus sp. SN-8-1]|uniref:hypothetical protein n=1 Tax=Paenibacillus sp. SN-8-1 TaxID=3435409 RepID=UPI003D9A190A